MLLTVWVALEGIEPACIITLARTHPSLVPLCGFVRVMLRNEGGPARDYSNRGGQIQQVIADQQIVAAVAQQHIIADQQLVHVVA